MQDRSFGLEIIEKVRTRTEGKINLNEGSVYPALKALEREGLVRSFEGEPLPERGGRPRRYYELTGEGRRAALEQKRAVLGLLLPAHAFRVSSQTGGQGGARKSHGAASFAV